MKQSIPHVIVEIQKGRKVEGAEIYLNEWRVKTIQIMLDFLSETIEVRQHRNDDSDVKRKICQPRIIYLNYS